ncbi:MAG: TolC family protein [bacterium]|nr:TolC family protein [bacterium]
MKKILISALLISVICMGNADAKVLFRKNKLTDEAVFRQQKTQPEKKTSRFFRKKNRSERSIQNVSDVITEEKPLGQEIQKDELYAEKQKAIDDANKDLNINNGVVQGQIQKDKADASNIQTIEGGIDETVILSLDDCVKKALENNPQIRSAFNNSEIYRTKIGQAWANYFPTFNISSGYTRNRFFSLNFSVPQRYYNYFNAMDGNLSMLLFDFGKTKATADMSKKAYESTLANLDETINTIIYDVKEAYYSLLHAIEKQNVYADSVQSYELQLKQAEAFYLIGTKPKIDVTMAQYNLGNAQLGYIKASNEVKLATAQLNNAMGVPEENNYKILDKLDMKQYEYGFDGLIQKAYEKRPELISYRKKAKSSEMMLRAAKRAFLPNIEGVGAYQVGGGAHFSDDYGWTVGAQIVYANTNLMLMKKQIDEAKATHKKDVADLDIIEQNVYLQVKQAVINLKNAQESIPVTALSLKHAQEQYRLASGRYSAGAGDAIELKDSEITYRNARLDYLTTLLQYNVSVANLERVVGAKLQEIEIEEK